MTTDLVPATADTPKALKALAASQRLFVLDTNVLIHDPAALFRFQEHDIHLPMMVLEELDRAKKGVSEVARNVRQASRFLDDLIAGASKEEIDRGLRLPGLVGPQDAMTHGRLYFQTQPTRLSLPATLPGNTPDHDILSMALTLQQDHPQRQVTLVSKDINLRIKAAILGLHAEDYYNDQALDDVNLLYAGTQELSEDFWEHHGKDLDSWKDSGRTFYRVRGPDVAHWYHNQGLFQADDQAAFIVRQLHDGEAVLEILKDYSMANHSIWGITARNREQNFALNLLLDPDVDFVSLLGAAGTGKTLLTLAAGLVQTLDTKQFREIIMTRVTVPVGEDMGFLPGTEEEKMTPWMGALMDNLEVLTPQEGGAWGRAATADLLSNKIKIRSLNFMRGRTFQNKYLIIDEAQNLTAKQMKTLITRAGPGTKVVCLGNIAQIDTPYLSETTSGLTYVVDRFKDWPHGGHVTLRRGERSRLAEFASERL
jgi:PhoH-like ATPase